MKARRQPEKFRRPRQEKIITVTVDKLIQGGQALARSAGKVCFLWNALPGETVEARVLEEKKGYIQATALQVQTAAPERLPPQESHFLSCSPWQILSWEAENLWKCEIAREAFARAGLSDELPAPLEIAAAPWPQTGTRNKIEYHFVECKTEGRQPRLSLALSGRRSHELIPVETCCLAMPAVNETALALLAALAKRNIPCAALRRLVVKTNGRGETAAALFTAKPLNLSFLPELPAHCRGWQLFQELGSKENRSYTPLAAEGDPVLEYRIREVMLRAGLQSFFQIHLTVFEMALEDMRRFLRPEKSVVDYYAGTGAVSLPLADFFKDAVLVEAHAEAAHFAEENIRFNRLTDRCKVLLQTAASATAVFSSEHFVILDPPRAGLEAGLLESLLAVRPERILYLSCDIATQARDIAKLAPVYKLSFFKLYNFFPRTPHFESLCILDRR